MRMKEIPEKADNSTMAQLPSLENLDHKNREQAELIEWLESRISVLKSEIRDLATMGAVITSILDIESILSVVIDMAVRLVKGEVGITLIEEKGKLVTRGSWGVNEQFIHSLEYKDSLDLPTYVFKNKEIVILNELDLKSEDGLVVDAVICLPIKTSWSVLGY